MEATYKFEIKYLAEGEETQFHKWYQSLDVVTCVEIDAHVLKLRKGLDPRRALKKGGLWELKIDYGPGYRVYYTQLGQTIILILAGSDKSLQARTIRQAENLLKAYKEELKGKAKKQRETTGSESKGKR